MNNPKMHPLLPCPDKATLGYSKNNCYICIRPRYKSKHSATGARFEPRIANLCKLLIEIIINKLLNIK